MADVTKMLLASAPLDPTAPSVARDLWAEHRGRAGVPLLTPPGANTKLAKSKMPSCGLSLMPANASGEQVCRYRTDGCTTGCVAYSGAWGERATAKRGRSYKTTFLAKWPEAFLTLLMVEIERAVKKDGAIAVRLNAFSDIPWEACAPALFSTWKQEHVQFYDYTKWPAGTRKPPANYDLTQSVSEHTNLNDLRAALTRTRGHRWAVVVPKTDVDQPSWNGVPCVNGDLSDERWLDPKPGLVLLKAKGRMQKGNPMVRELWKEKTWETTLESCA